jgi:hypothetical protein
MRGFALNWRLPVKGIQCASSQSASVRGAGVRALCIGQAHGGLSSVVAAQAMPGQAAGCEGALLTAAVNLVK